MGCCCCCSSEADKDESASEREGSSSVEVDVVRREERERERGMVLTEGRRRDLDFVVLLVLRLAVRVGPCQASRAPRPRIVDSALTFARGLCDRRPVAVEDGRWWCDVPRGGGRGYADGEGGDGGAAAAVLRG